MNTDGLKKLWKTVFGDPDSFINAFFQIAFSPDRCRFLEENGETICALYWFDCEYEGGKLAYIYAVATHPDHRGKGLASLLMQETHVHLKTLGYAGAVLRPATPSLFSFYERLGYVISGHICRFAAEASNSPVFIQELPAKEYGRLRRSYLPRNGVVQEGITLEFLQYFARFYESENTIFCISKDEPVIFEYLGDSNLAPDILAALGLKSAEIPTIGEDIPYAMFCPLNCTKIPGYLGISLD